MIRAARGFRFTERGVASIGPYAGEQAKGRGESIMYFARRNAEGSLGNLVPLQ